MDEKEGKKPCWQVPDYLELRLLRERGEPPLRGEVWVWGGLVGLLGCRVLGMGEGPPLHPQGQRRRLPEGPCGRQRYPGHLVDWKVGNVEGDG